MSASEPSGPYKVGERIGSSVWKGTDSRNGKTVALKILTKQLPKDQTKREALIRELRVSAALYHAFLAPIIEIMPMGDNLVMAMAFIEVMPISKYVNGKPMARTDFFRLSYQMVDAVKYLHTKGLIHCNINGDSVMVTPDGQIKLGGFNMTNLLLKPGGLSAAYQQKGNDPRSIAYMAPEQVLGQAVEGRTDLYSLGVVMYEMSTGKLPYDAPSAGEIARKIVEGQMVSPVTVNPNVDKAILGILGRCLFKDQFRREKDAKTVLEWIGKAEPDVVRYATELASRGTAASATASQDPTARQAIIFVGEVANYDALAKSDPEAASRAAARMQQILGEAVYLFDGQVLDPFGKRMIAEMPKIESALEAARKSEFDFTPGQQEGDPVQVRLLLHVGTLTSKDGAVGGDGLTRAIEVLSVLPPQSLHLTEEFVKKGRGGVRVRDAGARGGVKLFTIQPAETTQAQPGPAPSTATLEAEEAEAEVEMKSIVSATKKRKFRNIGIAAGVVVLVVIAAGAALLRKKPPPPVQTTTTSQLVPQSPRAAPQLAKVLINPIAVEGTDPLLTDRANAIQLSVTEILRHTAGIQLTDSAGPDVNSFAATLRTSTAGPEMLPQAPAGAVAVPVPVPDTASGIRAVLDWVAAQAHVAVTGLSQSPEALNQYAATLTTTATDPAKADASLKASLIADPAFLPAQLLAMRYFSTRGDLTGALAAAKQIMALDPTNIDAARMVARTTLSLGDVQSAFAAYNVILHNNAGDLEALTHVARYALSAGDTDKFNQARGRMQRISPAALPVHEADPLMASGRLGAALDAYFLNEEKVANNPALSLKIGRISVLRHSIPMAELELNKLQQTDPMYGFHILKAYMAGAQRNNAEAEAELQTAWQASTAGDEYWTNAAEVYVLLGENDKVLEALEKAVVRKEPTASYIMTDPLLVYLKDDARFAKIREAAAAAQQDIRNALAQVVI